MPETRTANDVLFDSDVPVAASGAWRYDPPTEDLARLTRTRNFVREASIALVLAISPLTHGNDPWLAEQKSLSPTTFGTPFQPIVGHSITILEARRVALEVLARAELERLRFAEEESRRGIEWES